VPGPVGQGAEPDGGGTDDLRQVALAPRQDRADGGLGPGDRRLGVTLPERVLGQQADEGIDLAEVTIVRFSGQDRTSGSTSTAYKPAIHLMLYVSHAIAKPGRPAA